MLLKNIIISTVIFALTVISSHAMQSGITATEETSYTFKLAVNENTMDCFRSLQCLIEENPFKNSNLDRIRLNNSRAQRFMVEGSSENEELKAVYLANGDLVEAKVIQRNIVLPRRIYETLASNEFSDWTMIENKLEIENFDDNTKRYQVVLSQDSEVRVEYFDKNGNWIQIHI